MQPEDWDEFIDGTEPEELKEFMGVTIYMYDKTVAAPTQAVKMLTAQKEYVGFTISYDALPYPYSDEEMSEAMAIIEQIKVQDLAETAVLELKERLLKNINKWPENPIFRNYLGLVYQKLKDDENTQKTILQLREQFPKYLYGKIMYAQMLLDQGKADQVPEGFNGQYNLKSIYPERDIFHISELLAFNTIMADYSMRQESCIWPTYILKCWTNWIYRKPHP